MTWRWKEPGHQQQWYWPSSPGILILRWWHVNCEKNSESLITKETLKNLLYLCSEHCSCRWPAATWCQNIYRQGDNQLGSYICVYGTVEFIHNYLWHNMKHFSFVKWICLLVPNSNYICIWYCTPCTTHNKFVGGILVSLCPCVCLSVLHAVSALWLVAYFSCVARCLFHGLYWYSTVEPLYNTIVFHQNTHKRHPIARP